LVGVYGLRQVQFRRQFRTNVIVSSISSFNVYFRVGRFSGCAGELTRMLLTTVDRVMSIAVSHIRVDDNRL